MNTTTNTRGVSEAMDDTDFTLADLRAAESIKVGEVLTAKQWKAECQFIRHQDEIIRNLRAALEATLSAEPAAQGEEWADESRKYLAYRLTQMADGGPLAFCADTLRDAASWLIDPPAPEPAAQGEEWSRRMAVLEAGQYVGAGAHGIEDRPAPPAQPAAPYFPDANALADWLESLHECHADGAVGNRKWEVAQIAAKAVRGAAQPAERVPDGWVLVPIPPANCRERLQREGKPYPRSGCAVCGKWAPKWRDCDVLLQAASIAASPEPSEGGKGVEG